MCAWYVYIHVCMHVFCKKKSFCKSHALLHIKAYKPKMHPPGRADNFQETVVGKSYQPSLTEPTLHVYRPECPNFIET